MSKISRFIGKVVTLAKSAVGGRGESATTLRGSGFADYAVVSLQCLRIYLEKSYCVWLDLLSEIPQILADIGLEKADFPDHSALVEVFDRIKNGGLASAAAPVGETARTIWLCGDGRGVFRPLKREQKLLPSNDSPGANTQNNRSRRYSVTSDPRRSLYDRETSRYLISGSVEILRELHVRRVIRRDEGPPEVANTPVY